MSKRRKASKKTKRKNQEYSCRKELNAVKDALQEFKVQVESIADMLKAEQPKQDLIRMRDQLTNIHRVILAINHQSKERSIVELTEIMEPTAIRVDEILSFAQTCIDAAEARSIH